MALFSRRHDRLPDDALDSLSGLLGRRVRPLAWGSGGDVLLVATKDCLAIRRGRTVASSAPVNAAAGTHDPSWGAHEASSAVDSVAERWELLGWHEIWTGGWSRDADTLSWTLMDGTQTSVVLTTVNRLPEVFRERVGASVAIEKVEAAPGRGRIVFAGRRNLATPDAPLIWCAMPSGGADLSDPRVREFVIARTAELRADYEP